MSKVPPTTEQLSDVDQLYRRLSAQDAGRPGEWVRRKVQAYAAQQAAERAVRSNAKGNEAVSVAATPVPPQRQAPVSAEEDISAPAGKPWVIPAVIGVVAAMAVVGWFVVPAMLGSGQTSKSPPVAAAQPEPPPPVAQAPVPASVEPAASQASEPEPAELSSAQTPVTNDSTTAAATPPAPPPTAQPAPAPAASAASPGAAAQVPSTVHPASAPAHTPAATASGSRPSATSGQARANAPTSVPATRPAAATVAQAPTQPPVAKTRIARQNAAPAASEQTASATPAAAHPTPVAEAAPAPKPVPPVETPVATATPAPAPAPTPAAAQPAPAPAAAGSSYPPDGLWTAAKAGDMSGLQGAFDNHVDLNSVGPEGETALILAIQHDRVEAVRALLAHGANPNTPDSRGLTPIRAARVRNNYNVLQALQRAGR